MVVNSLVAFLRARLDEDERIAQAAASEHGPSWITGYPPYIGELVAAAGPDKGLNVAESAPHHVTNPEDIVRHAAHWDPARALIEVKTKRRILDLVPEIDNADRLVESEWGSGSECATMADRLLKLLVVPYADHPDYDQTWTNEQGVIPLSDLEHEDQ
jgi:hypothetical protein